MVVQNPAELPGTTIPNGWRLCALGDIVGFLDGRRRPVKDSDRAKMRGEYPYYGASGIVDFVNDYLFDEDLILLGEDGENILSRNTRLAFRVAGKIWVNNHAHVLRPKEGYDIGFLAELLESLDYNQYNTGTAQPKLNKQVCSNIPMLVPPLPEQRAIAAALSDTDDLIAGLERLIAKKRAVKQATMRQLLTGKTRLPGFDGEWIVKRLGEIADLGRGRVISHREIAASLNPIYPVFSSQTTDDGVMGFIDTHDYEGEYVTWTTDGVNAGTVFYRNGRFNCTNVCGTIKVREHDTRFIALVLNTLAHSYVSRNLANPKLMNDVAKKIPICLPSLSEQRAVASVLSDMEAEIGALEQKRDKNRAIKQGMMQELLTGRIRLV